MLAEDSTEHRAFFRTGVEAFFFRTQTEMIEAARHLLGMPSAEADAVRKAARKRSMSSAYTYIDRARQALDAISLCHARRNITRRSHQ